MPAAPPRGIRAHSGQSGQLSPKQVLPGPASGDDAAKAAALRGLELLRPGRPDEQTRSRSVRRRRRGGRDAHRRPPAAASAGPRRPAASPHLEELRHQRLPDAPVRLAAGAARSRRPGGRQITLALSRVRHTAKTYQGPLLVNPGGPGGSGLTLAGFVASALPKSVAAQYDVIGFDPRGVGAEQARPGLPARALRRRCARTRVPSTPAIEQRQPRPCAGPSPRRAARSTRTCCPYIDTVSTVRDMDAIRAALGAPEDQLLRLLLRHLPGRRLRQALPAARAAPGARLDRRPRRRLVRRQPGPGPRVQRPPPGVPRLGRASTTPTYKLGTDPARVEAKWYAMRDALAKKPARQEGGRRRAGGHLHPGRLLQRLLALSGRGVRGVRERQGRRPAGRGVRDLARRRRLGRQRLQRLHGRAVP